MFPTSLVYAGFYACHVRLWQASTLAGEIILANNREKLACVHRHYFAHVYYPLAHA